MNSLATFLDYMNPTRFMALTDRALPWLTAAATLLLGVGLFAAFFLVPPDYQQGETVRIMYIHVPAAWLGVLVWRHPLADAAQKTAAPLGAVFTFVCLVTGSLWGKPMWGAYWVWDARLTSYLVLFLLYLGIIAIRQTMDDTPRGARVAAIMTLVGLGVSRRRLDHLGLDAVAAAGDGARRLGVVPASAFHGAAQRNSAPPHRPADAASGSSRRERRAGGGAMNDDAHWSYILLAYGVTFAIVGAVVWRIVSEHRRLLAELAQLQNNGGDDA